MALLVEKKSGIIDTLGGGQEAKSSKMVKRDKIKKSFISGYIDELRDVSWPTITQAITWFFTTLVVCTLLGTVILSFDSVYRGLFKFVECSSPKGTNVGVGQCLQELPKNIFQGNN
jgi:preprotein translocase SecE subunit